jgi:hypothetical protein
LGSGRQLVLGYTPCIIFQLILIAVSYKFATKQCIQACIIFVLLRAQVELLVVDLLAPLEPKLGFNRVKLWVGTFGLGYQYYIKLELLNSNFSKYVQMPIMLASFILTIYGVARL